MAAPTPATLHMELSTALAGLPSGSIDDLWKVQSLTAQARIATEAFAAAIREQKQEGQAVISRH